MASANLDLVRSIYADWMRGDYRSAEWADPEIEYTIADGPSPGSWTGQAGLAEGWRGILSVWEDLRTDVAEYRELNGERVLVVSHFSGRGRASGLEVGVVGQKVASVFHLRGGKVIRLVQYWDHRRALADLGLASDTPSPAS